MRRRAWREYWDLVAAGQFAIFLLVVGVVVAAAAALISSTNNLDPLATAEVAVIAGVGVPAVILLVLVPPVCWRALRRQRGEARAELARVTARDARRQVSGEHRRELQSILRDGLEAISPQYHQYNYGDPYRGRPFRHEMLAAHFPDAAAAIDHWNATVGAAEKAKDELRNRFNREASQLGLDQPPFKGDNITRLLADRTYYGAILGDLVPPVSLGARVRGWPKDATHPPDPPGTRTIYPPLGARI